MGSRTNGDCSQRRPEPHASFRQQQSSACLGLRAQSTASARAQPVTATKTSGRRASASRTRHSRGRERVRWHPECLQRHVDLGHELVSARPIWPRSPRSISAPQPPAGWRAPSQPCGTRVRCALPAQGRAAESAGQMDARSGKQVPIALQRANEQRTVRAVPCSSYGDCPRAAGNTTQPMRDGRALALDAAR
jgi:hypothetical protein